jgi:hypothetical protein
VQVSYLVLDEADKLLALGFAEQVDALLAAASNPHIQRALFSATLPDKVGLRIALVYSIGRLDLRLACSCKQDFVELSIVCMFSWEDMPTCHICPGGV